MSDTDVSGGIPWAIIGCGRLGSTLVLLAESLQVPLRLAWARSRKPIVAQGVGRTGPLSKSASEIARCAVFLTVADEAIAQVARDHAEMLNTAELVVHCSGSQSSEVLRAAGVTVPVGSVHPLLAVAEPSEALARMSDVVWSVEGEPFVTSWARRWLGAIDVRPVSVKPEGKTLYHASAVTAAGLLVGLMDTAFALAEGAGMTHDDARRMLVPLARSALENLESLSSADALTGPVARGDDEVVAAHRAAIEALDDELLAEVYDVLTRRTEILKG